MKNIKKIVATAMLCMFTMSVAGCSMIEKTPEAIQKTVVAKVGDKKITKGDVDSHFGVKRYLDQFKQQYGENFDQNPQVKEQLKQIKIQAANMIASQEALKQEAEKLKLVPNDEELKKEISKKTEEFKKEQHIKDDKGLNQALSMSGLTKEDFEKILKDKIIIEKLENALTKNVTVNDKEIQEYYNMNKDKYPKDAKNPTKIHVAHIILQVKSPEEDAKAKDEIKSIKDELNKGADFSVLAKKYSQDGSKDKGGDLGTVPAVGSGFDEDFMNAALKLKDGEVSQPIRSRFGYHIIKMIKKESKESKPLAEVKNDIKEAILQGKKSKIIKAKFKEIQDKANIKIYEEKLL